MQEKIVRYLNYWEQDPSNTNLLRDLIYGYMTIKDYQSALKVLDKTEKNATVFGLEALLYFEEGDLELSIEKAEASLVLDAQNFEAQLIKIYQELYEKKACTEKIKILLKVHPEESRLWFYLGNSFILEKKIKEAKEAYQQALTLYPAFYDCLIAESWCYLIEDNLEAAYQNYQRAIALEEEKGEGHAGLALVNLLKNNKKEAELHLEKARVLDLEALLTKIAEKGINSW